MSIDMPAAVAALPCNRVSIACRRCRRHRGAVLVWVAIVLIVLIGFVGLAVDFGFLFWSGQQLQLAADAGALAGAARIYFGHDAARAAAINIAGQNYAAGQAVLIVDNPGNDSAGDVVIGHYDPNQPYGSRFTPATDDTPSSYNNAVLVITRRVQRDGDDQHTPVPLFFGPLFGKYTANAERLAIAVCEGGPAEASIIALNPSQKETFYLRGNAWLDLGQGFAQVDSTNVAGATFQGSITFHAGGANLVAPSPGYVVRGNPDIPDPSGLRPSSPYVSDPYLALPDPPKVMPDLGTITGTRTFSPGYYSGGLKLNAGDNATLLPGIYYLDSDFTVNGHARLWGEQVMFYFHNGTMKDNGTGDVFLTPPENGTYRGIQFFQARTNTAAAKFNGNTNWGGTNGPGSLTNAVGVMYFPHATIELTGRGSMYISRVVADKILVSGDGHKYVTRNYDGGEIGQRVYLVE